MKRQYHSDYGYEPTDSDTPVKDVKVPNDPVVTSEPEEEEVVLKMEEDVSTADENDTQESSPTTSAYASLVKAKPIASSVQQVDVERDQARTSSSGLRFLERMYVRIKDSSTTLHKGSQGYIAELLPSSKCAIILDDSGGQRADDIPLEDLEPFTPDLQELSKLLVPGTSDNVARVVYLDEDTDEVTVEMRFEEGGGGVKNFYGTLDNVCKVISENNTK